MTQNQTGCPFFRNAVLHNVMGAIGAECIMAQIHGIDGAALTASSFGAFDSVYGQWRPIAYSGSYGNNGFFLNFSNATSATTLGADASGRGNNFTVSGFTLIGQTGDVLVDSPTNGGTGVGVTGNYPILEYQSTFLGG